jgi:hypothetical protein
MTVYNQHRRYFRSIGDFRCPRAILVDHIGTQIALWIAAGEQVLLFTDANSDVYRGILATRLASDDIRMTEQCREILGSESPASHSTGSNPITGIFATSGIDCKHVLQSAHKAGMGDHRFFVIDVDLSTMIGKDFPQLVRYEGRKLQSKKHRARKAYNKSLHKNVIQHKLIEKYDSLRLHHHHLTEEEKQAAINKLDNQKTELVYCGENQCRKIMNKVRLNVVPKLSYGSNAAVSSIGSSVTNYPLH